MVYKMLNMKWLLQDIKNFTYDSRLISSDKNIQTVCEYLLEPHKRFSALTITYLITDINFTFDRDFKNDYEKLISIKLNIDSNHIKSKKSKKMYVDELHQSLVESNSFMDQFFSQDIFTSSYSKYESQLKSLLSYENHGNKNIDVILSSHKDQVFNLYKSLFKEIELKYFFDEMINYSKQEEVLLLLDLTEDKYIKHDGNKQSLLENSNFIVLLKNLNINFNNSKENRNPFHFFSHFLIKPTKLIDECVSINEPFRLVVSGKILEKDWVKTSPYDAVQVNVKNLAFINDQNVCIKLVESEPSSKHSLRLSPSEGTPFFTPSRYQYSDQLIQLNEILNASFLSSQYEKSLSNNCEFMKIT